MKAETQELLHEGQVRWHDTVERMKEKVGCSGVKKVAADIYLSLPAKYQYALAKFGVRLVLKKKKEEIEEFLKH